jgi:hypothetical protein
MTVRTLGARALDALAFPAPDRPARAAARAEPMLSNHAHASLAAARLLREVVDYERRLRRLNTRAVEPEHVHLADAYRRALALRRELIAGLPHGIERAASPWPSS